MLRTHARERWLRLSPSPADRGPRGRQSRALHRGARPPRAPGGPRTSDACRPRPDRRAATRSCVLPTCLSPQLRLIAIDAAPAADDALDVGRRPARSPRPAGPVLQSPGWPPASGPGPWRRTARPGPGPRPASGGCPARPGPPGPSPGPPPGPGRRDSSATRRRSGAPWGGPALPARRTRGSGPGAGRWRLRGGPTARRSRIARA